MDKILIKWVAALIMLPILGTVFTACGDDDDSDSPIIGTWVDANITYRFNGDGKGYYYQDMSFIDNSLSSKTTFTWSLSNGNRLKIDYDDDGSFTVDYHVFLIVFNDNFTEMDMFYMDDGEYHGTFVKQ